MASPGPRRIVVLISGSGTNLQALIDAQGTHALPNAQIVLVLSNRKAAYGLQRAAQATPPIPTAYLAMQPYLKSHPGATRDDYDAALAHGHAQETFEGFTQRYVAFFQNAEDLFEVQRGLNNCFAHDLVPAPEVIEAALRASRRVDSLSTAVRVFEGLKEKVENKQQYQAYVDELKGVREELGIPLKEELYHQ